MTSPFKERFAITRRVVIGEDRSVGIVAVNSPTRYEGDFLPPAPRNPRPSAPRSGPVWDLRYWKSPVSFAADSLRAGDRISAQSRTWEVLTHAVNEVVGSDIGVEFCQVLPLTVAYPYTGTLVDLDSAVLVEEMVLAIWSGDEAAQDTGTYRDWSAEAPIEYHDQLQANRQILMANGDRYKVISAVANYENPRIEMTLRKAGIQS